MKLLFRILDHKHLSLVINGLIIVVLIGAFISVNSTSPDLALAFIEDGRLMLTDRGSFSMLCILAMFALQRN